MGEFGNFIAVPMLTEALKQIIEWTPEAIQNYCYEISKDALKELQELGFSIEDENYRSHHLIGIKIPDFVDIDNLKLQFKNDHIYVSFRGNYMRLSPHLYNTKEDFNALVKIIKATIR